MMQTIFIPCSSGIDVLPVVKKALSVLSRYQRVGVVTTSQHIHSLDSVRSFLEKNGKTVYSGGQVLGCNFSRALALKDDVDAYLYIGSGLFHPTGFFRVTEKSVFIANPYSGTVEEISQKELAKWKGRQRARIAKAASAEVFGILVSTRTGQFDKKTANEIKKRLESKGKEAYLFAGDDISPDRLLGFKVDAWINTACPRIAEDIFDKPVINPDELEVLL